MNKTIYLRDEEGPLWERARELANDKLSPIIVDALRKFVAEKEAAPKGYERIVLKFNDSHDNYLPKIKAFYGRWIYDLKEPLTVRTEEGGKYFYSVAETAKGNIVVYTHSQISPLEHTFLIYPSVEAAAADVDVDFRMNFVMRAVMERRGVPVEELDI